MGGGGGTPMGGRVGVPTITCHSTALPCPCYNHLTNLLEIQMKDTLLAIAIGLTMCALLLHWLDALFP
jgi:hypothetical protein